MPVFGTHSAHGLILGESAPVARPHGRVTGVLSCGFQYDVNAAAANSGRRG
nr:hypothetical protein [Kibdelosporangium sp. MJ126-NF4]